MSRMFVLVLLASSVGCAQSRWGFPSGQGTVDRQKARATIHDPYPLNDIGPEVVGGRPREFYQPQSEAVRQRNTEQLPGSFYNGR